MAQKSIKTVIITKHLNLKCFFSRQVAQREVENLHRYFSYEITPSILNFTRVFTAIQSLSLSAPNFTYGTFVLKSRTRNYLFQFYLFHFKLRQPNCG